MDADLDRLARRLFWWKNPTEALVDQNRFLAQLMTFGTWDDIVTARKHWSADTFRAALRHAPPGVFDARSWTYWHRALDLTPIPPLPVRILPDGT